MLFCVWLLSFNIMFSRFIHGVACVSIPFLYYGQIIFHYMVIYHISFIYLFGWWTSGLFLLYTFCKILCENIFSGIQGIYVGLELLGCFIVL